MEYRVVIIRPGRTLTRHFRDLTLAVRYTIRLNPKWRLEQRVGDSWVKLTPRGPAHER